MSLRAKAHGQNSEPSSADRDAMYDLALKSAEKSIDVQREELSQIRTRAVAFVALTVTSTAFMAGAGLGHTSTDASAGGVVRDALFYWLAGAGTLLFLSAVACLIGMTVPAIRFRFAFDPKAVGDAVEGDVPAPSKAVLVRYLIKTEYPSMWADNEASLVVVRRLYRSVLVLGILGLLAWVSVTWLYA